jgi:hypothetical protein
MLLMVALMAPSAIAQDDIRVLRLARFESEENYQAYADWIKDIENIRFALIANGRRWTPTVEAWAKEYLQNPANVESNDDIYLITYAEGGLDKKAAYETLETIIGAYAERLRRQARKRERDHRVQLDKEFAAMDRQADDVLLGKDEEQLRLELREISDQLLKAKLKGAQSEARSRALMEYERKQHDFMLEKKSPTEADDLRRDLAERKLAEATRRLEEVLALKKNGLVMEEDVGKAEIAMQEAVIDLSELKEDLKRRKLDQVDTNLQPMLIEAEAERAGALALDAVLQEHEVKLRKMLEQHRHYIERRKALEREMKEFNQIRSQPSTRRPVSTQAGAPLLIYPES